MWLSSVGCSLCQMWLSSVGCSLCQMWLTYSFLLLYYWNEVKINDPGLDLRHDDLQWEHGTFNLATDFLGLHLCSQFTKQNTAFLPQTYSVTPLWSVYQAEHSIPPSNRQTVLHLCGQFTKQNTAFLPQTVKQCDTSVVSLPSRTQHSSHKPSVLSLFLTGQMFVCRTYYGHFDELWFVS